MFSVDVFRQQIPRGPVQATGLTSALKVVSRVNLLPGLQLAGHKSSAVHIQDLLTLSDQPGGEGQDLLSLLYSGIVWVTRVVDQGQGRIDCYAYLHNLIAGPFIALL